MKVTQENIQEFNLLYLKYKTYAEVARQTGFSPSTVKKYIVNDFKVPQKENVKNFERYSEKEKFNPISFFEEKDLYNTIQWGDYLIPTIAEREEMNELFPEISI